MCAFSELKIVGTQNMPACSRLLSGGTLNMFFSLYHQALWSFPVEERSPIPALRQSCMDMHCSSMESLLLKISHSLNLRPLLWTD